MTHRSILISLLLSLTVTACAEMDLAALLPAAATSGPEAIVTAGPDETQVQSCSYKCTVVNGKPTQHHLCKPYVAPGQPDPFAYPPVPAGPACMSFSPAMIIAPKSSNCWISPKQYCVYNPKGNTGYPCSCQGRSGYFG
jgi:hypothetical protein